MLPFRDRIKVALFGFLVTAALLLMVGVGVPWAIGAPFLIFLFSFTISELIALWDRKAS